VSPNGRWPRKPYPSQCYGVTRKVMRQRLAPIVANGTTPCARCGDLIEPGEKWELDHKGISLRRRGRAAAQLRFDTWFPPLSVSAFRSHSPLISSYVSQEEGSHRETSASTPTITRDGCCLAYAVRHARRIVICRCAETLPKNSVGSAQVVNGSLQKVDLSTGAVASLRGLREVVP
jgi:hypothetical protein